MKKGKLFGSLLTVVFALSFVLASCTNKTKREEVKQDLNKDVEEFKKEAQEDMHNFKNYTYAQKDQFVKDANDELIKMNNEIDKLKAELDKSGDQLSAETRAQYQRSISEMEKVRDDYKMNVDKVQNSTEDTWEKTKSDVSEAYMKTKSSIKEGWNDVKRNVGKGADKVKDKLKK